MNKLTDEQRAIVEHAGGHALVAAVAGSGKTETLLHRLARVVRIETPSTVCVVMFNTSAATSFRERFQKQFKLPSPEIRTFNSMGHKLLSKFVEMGVIPSSRLEERESGKLRLAREALGAVWREYNGDSEAPDKELIASFVTYVGLVKSDILPASEVYENGRYQAAAACFPEAFDRFEALRLERQVHFFDDQIYVPVKAMLAKPELQKLVANRMAEIMTDETQDVNGIQVELVKILAGDRARVIAVGDDDQSIYGWRGSKPEFFVRDFERHFNPVTKLFLTNTFRFGHAVALASGHLISHNKTRIEKMTRSHAATPATRITCVGVGTDNTALIDALLLEIEAGTELGEIAILVRQYSFALGLELELIGAGVPYYVYGRPPILRIPELSALIGVLHLAGGEFQNRMSEEDRLFSIRSILMKPSLYLKADRADAIAQSVCAQIGKVTEVMRACITRDMRPSTAEQLADRADLLGIVMEMGKDGASAADVLNAYLGGTGFEANVRRQADSPAAADETMSNVNALVNLARRFPGSLADFIAELDPLCDSGATPPPTTPHAKILSVHRAKGLEFEVVAVPGLGRGTFPRDGISVEDTEAERRLAYVAYTRAKRHLLIAHPVDGPYAEARASDGPGGGPESVVSRFLWEARVPLAQHASKAIANPTAFVPMAVVDPAFANRYLRAIGAPDRLVYTDKPQSREWTERASKTPAPGEPSPETMPPNTTVVTPSFGAGTVEGWVNPELVRVRFADGVRTLLARIAKLTRA